MHHQLGSITRPFTCLLLVVATLLIAGQTAGVPSEVDMAVSLNGSPSPEKELRASRPGVTVSS
jgi:hypothetical protein